MAKKRKIEIDVLSTLPIKSSFAIFLKEVSKYPPLPREEEVKLARRVKRKGDLEAAKKLVLSNLRFVIKVAMEYRNWGIPVEDIVQEGILGLIFAVKKFDPDKGVKFISYASYWIRAFIHNCVISNFSIVKMGTTQAERKIFANIFKIREDRKDEDIKEQAMRLGVPEEKIRDMDTRVHSKDVSMDGPQDEGGALRLSDMFASDELYDPANKVELMDGERFVKEKIDEAISNLTDQEVQVIKSRYLTYRPKTLKELSEIMGISKERVRQVEERALEKMKCSLSPYLKSVA